MKNKPYKPKIGDKVQDRDGNIGIVTKIENIHNIFVKFLDGGRGIFCLSRSKKCHRPQPYGHYDPLFPAEDAVECPKSDTWFANG